MMSEANYEVLIIRYGTRRARRSEVFLDYPVYGEPDAPLAMDYFVWVVRNAERTVVIDTGFSREAGERRARTMLVDPRDALAAVGVAPIDEPTVVITHAHYDHLGNLAHFDRSPVVIAAAELEFWTRGYGRERQFQHLVETAEIEHLERVAADGRAVLFHDRITVAEGLEVVRVGGHTPGQSIVRVSTAAGPVLLASDAIHYHEELDRRVPFVSCSSLVDVYAGFDTINRLVATGDVAHVVSGHDPDTVRRFGRWADGPPGIEIAVIG
jgi:glyoxylase-like metal-dependent hydrolase (beta-lactamase superfamily II)